MLLMIFYSLGKKNIQHERQHCMLSLTYMYTCSHVPNTIPSDNLKMCIIKQNWKDEMFW